MTTTQRIAGAPISWGVSEVPGWGHQMRCERVLAELRERGAPRVVLHTAVQNTAAHKLFESAGFRRTMLEMTCEL